jgi:hypothetical protein
MDDSITFETWDKGSKINEDKFMELISHQI